MKNFFKKISGRPKDGEIIECIKPFIAIPQCILALGFLIFAIKNNSFLSGITALLIAWQIGWGMSIERFYKNDTK